MSDGRSTCAMPLSNMNSTTRTAVVTSVCNSETTQRKHKYMTCPCMCRSLFSRHGLARFLRFNEVTTMLLVDGRKDRQPCASSVGSSSSISTKAAALLLACRLIPLLNPLLRTERFVVRVMISSEHPFVRDDSRHILQGTSGFVIAGEANDGSSTIALVRSVHAHVIVLDLSMPGRAAVELIKQIKLDRPRLRMLVLATHAVQRDAMRSFRAGAAGYLTRECASAELAEAVSRVATGGVYVSLSMPESVAESPTMPADAQG